MNDMDKVWFLLGVPGGLLGAIVGGLTAKSFSRGLGWGCLVYGAQYGLLVAWGELRRHRQAKP